MADQTSRLTLSSLLLCRLRGVSGTSAGPGRPLVTLGQPGAQQHPVDRVDATELTLGLLILPQLGPGEPAGLDDLVAVDGYRLAGGGGQERDHQARRERPGLGADVPYLAQRHAGLLEDLAPHRVLPRLALFQEAAQQRVAAGRRGAVPGEQAPPRPGGGLDHSDDRGLDAREDQRAALAVRAGPQVTRVPELGGRAAAAAVPLLPVPV